MKLESLDKYITVLSGFPFNSELFNKEGIGLPLIRVRDVNSGFSGIYYSGKYPNEYVIYDGDILIGMDGDFNVVVWEYGTALLNQRVCKLIIDEKKLNKFYLLHYLPKALKKIHGKTTFTTVKHLSTKSIRDIRIPLPENYDDQIRIAAVLTRAEKLIAKRKESIKVLDELLKSTFLEMFGDPVKNEKRWEKKPLRNISDIQGGLQITSKRASNSIELPYLRVANVYRDFLDLREIKTIRVTEAEAKRVCLKKEDILIVEGHGNPTEIGRSAVWDGSIQNCLHQNHLIRVRVNTDYALPVFISFYINSAGGRQQMFKAGKTTSGLNTISTKNVKETLVLLPPLSLQKQFITIVEKVETLKTKYVQSLTELQFLYDSLSQRAFKGNLDLNKMPVDAGIEPEAMMDEMNAFETSSLIKFSQEELTEIIKTLSGRPFSFNDLWNKVEEASFESAPEYEEIKDMIYTRLKGKNPVLKQSFEEVLDESIGERIKKIVLRVDV